MSAISSFYNILFSVKREITGSGVNSRLVSLMEVSSGNEGVIRPITDNSKLYDLSHIGKEYRLFCNHDIDIKASDVVVVGSTEYNVRAVNSFIDLEDAMESHLEVVLVKR